MNWLRPRRQVFARHPVTDKDLTGGKNLIDAPGHVFPARVTSLSVSPLAVWRYYNGRADCENVIKELQSSFALGTLCPDSF